MRRISKTKSRCCGGGYRIPIIYGLLAEADLKGENALYVSYERFSTTSYRSLSVPLDNALPATLS